MTQPQYDVVAIGNAIVDVIAQTDDAFLAEHTLTKGGMQLIDAETADLLYSQMSTAREMSGGSAANTLAGLAALYGIGRIAFSQTAGLLAMLGLATLKLR